MLLEQSVRESGSELLIDKAGRAHFVGQEAARNAQLDNARKDASPFIELGKVPACSRSAATRWPRPKPACR